MCVTNGDLRIVGGVEGMERPSFLALHPDGTKLYATSETEGGELYAYQVNAQTGNYILWIEKGRRERILAMFP